MEEKIKVENNNNLIVINTSIKNSREYLFDNLKVFLIILVVFGHLINKFDNQVFKYVYEFIYIFHMPVFIFISGYFSKKKENIKKNIRNLILPYLIFNTIYNVYLIYFDSSFNEKLKDINIFYPREIYWYLISLFLWRILIKYVDKLKHPFVIMFLLSIYIGTVSNAEKFLSISRTIVYFPFFILGYYTNKEKILKIKNFKKRYFIPFTILVLICSFLFIHLKVLNKDLLYNSKSYNANDVKNLVGMGIRFLQFILAISIGLILIKVCSAKEHKFTLLGQKTITILVFSLYVQEIILKIIELINIKDYLNSNSILLAIFLILSTIIIVFICTRKIVVNIYNKVLDFVFKIFFKESNKK